MKSEYILVCVEILVVLLSAVFSYYIQRYKKDDVVSWKDIRKRMIWFFVLLAFMLLYIIENNKGAQLLEIVIEFIVACVMFIIFFVIELFILNIVFGLFQEEKPSRLHFMTSLLTYLKSMNMNTLSYLSSVFDICFLFACFFSLGSMIVAFVTDYAVAYYHLSTEIYLLEVGPALIFVFVIIAGSLWMVGLLTAVIELYKLTQDTRQPIDYMKRKQRQELKEKIEYDKHSW